MNNSVLEQAMTAHQQGQQEKAENLYRQVLANEPENPDALALLGVLKQAEGHLKEAEQLVRRAVSLDPKAPLFCIYLGSVLLASGDVNGAFIAYRQAAQLAPAKPEPYFGMGYACLIAQKWKEAEIAFKQTLKILPQHYEARNNLARVYMETDRMEEAYAELKQVVRDAPSYGAGWLNLCNVAEKMEDYERSVQAGEMAVKLIPDNFESWFGLGVALNRVQRDEDALKAYHEALRLKPDRADIWDNLGQTYQFLNKLEESRKAYWAAIEADDQLIEGDGTRFIDEKEYGNRHWHLALMELLLGDYKNGFARYRARFEDVGGLRRPDYTQPLWLGEDLHGKTILIREEQGMGDTIMFSRYLPMLKERGAKVKFLLNGALAPLFALWDGCDEVVPKNGPLGDFDTYASVFDLPFVFGTTMETVPNKTPCLPLLPPDEITQLEPTDKLKVAIVWAGAPLHKHDHKRSIPLQKISKLFDTEGTQFYSLNFDMRAGDDELLSQLNIINLVSRLKSFEKTARIINQMDLVISCDTATAHLSGCMNKRVWTLLPFAPDWRWLVDREDTVWYPSMRLFRQPQARDWDSVIANVQTALVQLVQETNR